MQTASACRSSFPLPAEQGTHEEVPLSKFAYHITNSARVEIKNLQDLLPENKKLIAQFLGLGSVKEALNQPQLKAMPYLLNSLFPECRGVKSEELPHPCLNRLTSNKRIMSNYWKRCANTLDEEGLDYFIMAQQFTLFGAVILKDPRFVNDPKVEMQSTEDWIITATYLLKLRDQVSQKRIEDVKKIIEDKNPESVSTLYMQIGDQLFPLVAPDLEHEIGIFLSGPGHPQIGGKYYTKYNYLPGGSRWSAFLYWR